MDVSSKANMRADDPVYMKVAESAAYNGARPPVTPGAPAKGHA